MLETTGKRITARVPSNVQVKLEVAAQLAGATLNQFIVQAALEKADKVIESEAAMVMTRRESLRLIELLDHPPPRNAKFLAAQGRYRKTKRNAGTAAERAA